MYIILIFGAPNIVQSDNGPQLRAKMFRDVCQEHGIKNFFICNHYAASNPVERHNKTIKIALSQYSKDDHRDWDIYLPFVTFAINTS